MCLIEFNSLTMFKVFKNSKIFGTFRNKNEESYIARSDFYFYFQLACRQTAVEKDERTEHINYIYNFDSKNSSHYIYRHICTVTNFHISFSIQLFFQYFFFTQEDEEIL